MKKFGLISIIAVILVSALVISLFAVSAFADNENEAVTEDAALLVAAEEEAEAKDPTTTKAIAAAAVVGVVAAVGAIGMAVAISKSVDGMARQPEASEKINSSMMLGLVFIETAIIYALIIAILVIFVL